MYHLATPLKTICVLTILYPISLFAETVTAPKNFAGLVAMLVNIIQVLVSAVFAITVVVVIWSIINHWIIGGEKNRDDGKKQVTVGIIVLVVMSVIWSVLYILQTSILGF